MAGLQVSGLVSSIDTTSIISQLMQVEANPQTLLKNKLVAVQADAAAYRAVNTRFAALKSAADALTTAGLTAAKTASSSSASVTASAGTTAVKGASLTFSVTSLASSQTLLSNSEWTSATGDARAQEPAWPIEVLDGSGASKGTIDIPPGATLNDAAAAINTAAKGLTASVVQVGTNRYRLQLTSQASGSAGAYVLKSATEDATTAGSSFLTTTAGTDATLDLGGGVQATSSTNTFANLLSGLSVTVSKADAGTPVSVSVGTDASSVANKMSNLIDAANSLLDSISSYTDTKSDTAILKGDSTLRALSGQILDLVSSGVDGLSAADVGVQTTRDGHLVFDKAAFSAKLASDPTIAAKLLTSTTAVNAGPDGIPGNIDDVTTPVGIVAQLGALAKTASDTTTGTIVTLANSQDSQAKDLTARISDWDIRLALRKDSLTTQFTAMTTALSSLQNQSSWLTSQLASLPSWSQSSK